MSIRQQRHHYAGYEARHFLWEVDRTNRKVGVLTLDRPEKKNPLTWYGPVLAGNRLVLVNSLGDMVFASPSDGTVGQTIPGKDGFGLGPVVANNTLYVLDGRGRISAYR